MCQKIFKYSESKWLWLLLVLVLSLPIASRGAEGFSNSELDTLVSTIALYPDPLLVHVLTASTYGDQIPGANAWAQSHKDLKGENLALEMEKANLPYDPSVQALIPFPSVLNTLATYRTWADQLGDAVSMQKDQVMDAVQRMRLAAYNHGQLKSNEQVNVQKTSTIIIEPTRTEYVYVPVYNPRVVYYVYADGYPTIHYRHGAWLGSWYGEWGWGSCWFEWDSHLIYVRDHRWYHHRPIPRHPRRYQPPRRRSMERAHGFHESNRPSSNLRMPRQEGVTQKKERNSVGVKENSTSRAVQKEHRLFVPRETDKSEEDSYKMENRRWEDSRKSSVNRQERSTTTNSNSGPVKRSSTGGNGGFSRAKRR